MRKVTVIKVGGRVAEDEAVLNSFLDDFVNLKGFKVLVHGGGVIATQMAKKLGIETEMIDGRRVTDKDMLEVTTMVYAGLVNKNIVAKLQSRKVNAIGLTGADLNIIHSLKRNPVPVDFGWVGDIETVDANWLQVFLEQGVIPVIAPLTHDGKGNMLNTNADSIASFIASRLANKIETDLISCFDREGVFNGDEILSSLRISEYDELKNSAAIKDGMIPKLDLGFEALSQGVNSVTIKGFDALSDETKGTRLIHE
jgi:acetylglutamate kinase